MHITILALGSRGDVQPYATLGKGLRSAGHHVCFVTSEDFGPLIARHNLEFIPIPGNAQEIVNRAGADMLAMMRGFGRLAQNFAINIPASLQETDVLINQLPLALWGYDLAEKLQRPMFVAAVIPLTPTTAFPAMGFPSLRLPGYNRLTYALGEQIGWQMFRPSINRWRTRILGLPPTGLRGYFHHLGTSRFPVLNGFSRYVVPRPKDWSEHVHTTGYWFTEDDTWQPPDTLRAFLEAGPPPVFIGFGSMPVSDPQQTTRIILDAIRRSGQRAILHAGWGGIGSADLPDSVFKIDYAPYAWLFPRMAMIIHHGGSGTTAFGLRSGVPCMVVPFLFDQFYWGQRIAALGVGPAPIPFKNLSAERLAQAIAGTVSNPQMQQRAADLGQRIQTENGIANAVQIIQSYVNR